MKLVRVITLIAFVLTATSLFADTYQIDPKHSRVEFSVKHLMISTVRGQFKTFDATINFDPNDPSKDSITGSIKTASIDTGNENRDNDLRTNQEFFAAEKYPEITFSSKKVEKKGNVYNVSGTLTVKGISKDVVLPVTVNGPIKDPMGGKQRIGIETTLTIKRHDYGIVWDKRLDNGGAVVSEEVQISITGEAASK
jgi:polyisoprenoid-binding protein YceI